MPELRLGSRMCYCDTCGVYFGGDKAFDMHRVGRHEPYERRCLTADEMVNHGLECRNEVWRQKAAKDRPAHWAKAETVEEDA